MTRLLTIVFLLVCLLLPATSKAARQFMTGFEEGVLSTTTMWVTAGANTSAVTTPHSGTYSGKSTSTSAKGFLTTLTSVATGTKFVRFYWQTNAAGVADSRIFRTMSGTNVSGAEIYKLSTGAIRLANAIASTTADSSLIVSINTWYRFELKHVISDTAGYLVLNIYASVDSSTATETLVLGASDANGTGANADTLPVGIASFSWEESTNSSGLTYLWDDLAINDATGTFQTSYPGPGSIYMLVPDSNVSMQWETSAGAADSATFSTIDDLPGAPNDADYNAVDTTLDALDALGNIDQMGMTNLGAEVPTDATLAVIGVYGRVGSNQTSAAHLRFKLWDESASLTNGPSVIAQVNGWRILTMDTEPLIYNPSGKTKANIDSFNVGYEDITDTIVARPRRISALWVNVEWSGGTVPAALQSGSGFLPAVIR